MADQDDVIISIIGRDELSRPSDRAAASLDRLDRQADKTSDSVDELGDSQEQTAKQTSKHQQEVDKTTKSLDQQQRVLDKTRIQLEGYRKELAQGNITQAQFNDIQAETDKRVQRLQKSISGTRAYLKGLDSDLTDLDRTTNRYGDSVDDLGRRIQHTDNFLSRLKRNVLTGWIGNGNGGGNGSGNSGRGGFFSILGDFGEKFMKYGMLPTKIIAITAAVSYLGTALKGLGAAAYAGVAGLAPLTGLLVAYPGIISTFVLALATIKVATGGLGDAFKVLSDPTSSQADIAKATKDQSKNAVAFLKAVIGSKQQGFDLRKGVQSNFFDGLDKSYKQLISSDLPLFKKGLDNEATALNRVVRSTVDLITKQKQQRILSGIMKDNAVETKNYGAGLNNVLLILGHLVNDAGPMLRTLSQDFDNATGSLLKDVDANDSRLTAFFTRSLSLASAVTHTLGDYAVGLFNIGRASMGLATYEGNAIEKYGKMFRAYTENKQNQAKIRNWFTDLEPVLGSIVRLLVALGGALNHLSLSNGNFVKVNDFVINDVLPGFSKIIDTIVNGVLPTLKELNAEGIIGSAVSALEILGHAIADFADIMSHLPHGVLAGISAATTAAYIYNAYKGKGIGGALVNTVLGRESVQKVFVVNMPIGGFTGPGGFPGGPGGTLARDAERAGEEGLVDGLPFWRRWGSKLPLVGKKFLPKAVTTAAEDGGTVLAERGGLKLIQGGAKSVTARAAERTAEGTIIRSAADGATSAGEKGLLSRLLRAGARGGKNFLRPGSLGSLGASVVLFAAGDKLKNHTRASYALQGAGWGTAFGPEGTLIGGAGGFIYGGLKAPPGPGYIPPDVNKKSKADLLNYYEDLGTNDYATYLANKGKPQSTMPTLGKHTANPYASQRRRDLEYQILASTVGSSTDPQYVNGTYVGYLGNVKGAKPYNNLQYKDYGNSGPVAGVRIYQTDSKGNMTRLERPTRGIGKGGVAFNPFNAQVLANSDLYGGNAPGVLATRYTQQQNLNQLGASVQRQQLLNSINRVNVANGKAGLGSNPAKQQAVLSGEAFGTNNFTYGKASVQGVTELNNVLSATSRKFAELKQSGDLSLKDLNTALNGQGGLVKGLKALPQKVVTDLSLNGVPDSISAAQKVSKQYDLSLRNRITLLKLVGSQAAIAQARQLQSQLNALKNKTVTLQLITERKTIQAQAAKNRAEIGTPGSVPGAYTGANTPAGKTYLTGEMGPEMWLSRSGRLATLLGANGPEYFTPPADGAVIASTATKDPYHGAASMTPDWALAKYKAMLGDEANSGSGTKMSMRDGDGMPFTVQVNMPVTTVMSPADLDKAVRQSWRKIMREMEERE